MYLSFFSIPPFPIAHSILFALLLFVMRCNSASAGSSVSAPTAEVAAQTAAAAVAGRDRLASGVGAGAAVGVRLSSEPIPRRVRVTKLLPKYVASSSDVIFTPQLLQNIRDELNERAGASNSSPSLSKSELSIDAEDAPSDPFSIELKVVGWSDLVEETKSIIADVLHSHIICHKQNELLRSNDSIELDLRLDPRHKLGLSFDGLRSTLRRSTRGVWFKLQAGEQMNAILGQAAVALGGVLLKIGDRTVDTVDDATNAWDSLVGDSVVVTVCIHKDADTRSINQSHLDRKPRRRGGGAYRGPLRVPSESTSGSNLSGTSASSKRKRKLSKGDDGDEKRKKTASKPPSAQNVAATGKRDWSVSGERLRQPSRAPVRAGVAATKALGFASKRSTPLENSADDSKKSSIDPDAAAASSSSSKKSHAKTGSLLLRPDRIRKTGRKVSFFRGGHEERVYLIGSSVTGRIAEDSSDPSGNVATKGELAYETGDAMSGSPTKGAALDMDVPINVRRSKKLLDAIWNGDYRDVLRLLKEGAPVSMRDKNNLAPIDHVKKKMVELESQLREASGDDKPILKDSLADFKRKSILLKIYIHVEHNISLLWAIDDWQNIQIAVDSINGLTLSPEGWRHPSSPDVFCVMVLENR